MKNYFWIIFALLIITSCQFNKEKEEKYYPFTDLEISSINKDSQNNFEIKDSAAIKEVSIFLKKLSSEDLIKGRRLHGAEKLCDIIIKNSTDNDILIFISSHKEDGITADFLQERKADNFTYFLGRLYDANKFMHLLDKHGLNCNE